MNTVQNFEIEGGRVARFARCAVAAAVLAVIAACGGGGGGSPTDSAGGEATPEVIAVQKPTATEASRFLVQATMGATPEEIDRLTGMTYAAWLDDQFAKPQSGVDDLIGRFGRPTQDISGVVDRKSEGRD